MAENGVADVCHHALADPHHEVEAQCRAHRQHHDDRQHGEEILVDEQRILGGEAVVDDAAHRHRHGQRGAGCRQQGDQREQHLLPIGPQEGREAEEGTEIPALGAPPRLVFVGIAHEPCSSG